ncbi:bifunctional oligoribonuclease/PAP phosphatase NrnA [Exiguobacterium sp. AM39-5BH]|uniref:DHH family phosphoesterase n=1 Tax=Exiguobacterium sp. AM39-5BH TaxID=2292355 RepID=UPI000FE2127B|nr:bifunctional oligoribonuclease/PAP phosphatase NrnA [Exiguobacterium sp. AM39-5BH]RHB51744.1 bifunctional oligoribonuclease/PAP phosphatase NrnA [Exiguobacterium sp. AM39-5BH]
MAHWPEAATILKLIETADTIMIHRHVRPDPDALGSQLGLKRILEVAYPEKKIYVVGGIVRDLEFLGRMEHVEADMYKEALVIVLDTANQERIDGPYALTGKTVVKIDHHPDEDPYADHQIVDTTVSSTSEMIVELAGLWGLSLDESSAFSLFAGIVGDTGRFQFRNATPRTFEVAAELIKHGIDTNRLYRQMYKTNLATLQLQGYVLQNVNVTEAGVGYVKIDANVLRTFHATPEAASLLVNSFSGLEGLKCWVMFVENKDEIRVRIRSKGPVINEVAKRYRGGGHPMAAGATIDTWEEMDEVITALDEVAAPFTFETEES